MAKFCDSAVQREGIKKRAARHAGKCCAKMGAIQATFGAGQIGDKKGLHGQSGRVRLTAFVKGRSAAPIMRPIRYVSRRQNPSRFLSHPSRPPSKLKAAVQRRPARAAAGLPSSLRVFARRPDATKAAALPPRHPLWPWRSYVPSCQTVIWGAIILAPVPAALWPVMAPLLGWAEPAAGALVAALALIWLVGGAALWLLHRGHHIAGTKALFKARLAHDGVVLARFCKQPKGRAS